MEGVAAPGPAEAARRVPVPALQGRSRAGRAQRAFPDTPPGSLKEPALPVFRPSGGRRERAPSQVCSAPARLHLCPWFCPLLLETSGSKGRVWRCWSFSHFLPFSPPPARSFPLASSDRLDLARTYRPSAESGSGTLVRAPGSCRGPGAHPRGALGCTWQHRLRLHPRLCPSHIPSTTSCLLSSGLVTVAGASHDEVAFLALRVQAGASRRAWMGDPLNATTAKEGSPSRSRGPGLSVPPTPRLFPQSWED